MEGVNGFLTEEQAEVHAATEALVEAVRVLRCTNCGAEEDFCQCKPTTFQPMTTEEWKDQVVQQRLYRKKQKKLRKAQARMKERFSGKPQQRSFYDAGTATEGSKLAAIDPESFDYSKYVTWKSCSHEPQHVIAGEGWGVWAGKRFNCERHLHEYDLVINLAGYTVRHKNHTIPVPELHCWESYSSKTPEIVLDWPDGWTVDLPYGFWHDLMQYIVQNGKRALVFCLGGHGRTGTALASMLVARGESAPEAIRKIREHYCDEAIETVPQEEYIAEMAKQRQARG